MSLEPAKREDLDQIIRMIGELSRWLKTKGIHQWSGTFPREVLEGELSRGELFVLREEGEIVASVALSKDAGEFWDTAKDSALYLHRLAVVRSRAGEKLGEAIMAWAENHARENGASLLRLVCDAKNPYLPGYYARLGYEPRGTALHEQWRMTFARFEKVV